MANQKQKNANGQGKANGSPHASREGVYFLSITLENVRCFGEKQTLNLSDSNSKPAQWTILLGNNGTGKTTFLQTIALLAAIPVGLKESGVEAIVGKDAGNSLFSRLPSFPEVKYGFPRWRDYPASLNAKVGYGAVICEPPEAFDIFELSLTAHEKPYSYCLEGVALSKIICFGYGAARRMAERSLPEGEPDWPCALESGRNIAGLRVVRGQVSATFRGPSEGRRSTATHTHGWCRLLRQLD